MDIKNLPKKDYLTIPIEMYKCEVTIKKNRKLTEMEKLTLKYIYNENMLGKVINAFDVGPYIINNVLAKLFYRGLIRLKLDERKVQLNKEIMELIEKDKLEEYIDKAAENENHYVTIIQEKVSGEIFTENTIKDYTKNPGFLITNYIDLKASPLDQFPDLKDMSLNKYIKCIRSEIRADPEDISKISFIRPIHQNKIYIPLNKRDDRNYLELDLELFPRHVQKAWQNAYELEYNIQPEEFLNLTYEEPQFISINLFKIHLNKDLILLEDNLKKYNLKNDEFRLNQYLQEDYDEIKRKLKKLKVIVQSVNNTQFLVHSEEYLEMLRENMLKAKEFIIICSTELSSNSIPFLSTTLSKLNSERIKVILIYNSIKEDLKGESEFKERLSQKMNNMKKIKVYLLQAIFSFDSNFILIDSKRVIFNNSSFLSIDYEHNEILFPSLVIEGGTTPIHFLEFCIELFPKSFLLTQEFDKIITESYRCIDSLISNERLNFIRKLDIVKKRLKSNIKLRDFKKIKEDLIEIKSTMDQIGKFENISIIKNSDHLDLLIDAMRETNEDFTLYTDFIEKEQLGPHFQKYLQKIHSFSIIFNKISNRQDESEWYLGISKLEKIKDNRNNFEYKVVEGQYIFNMLIVKGNFLIFTNHRFLSKDRSRRQMKKLGLILYPKNIEEIVKVLKEKLGK